MITSIYDDKLLPLIKEGKATTKRVSNVEPGEGGWIATMLNGVKLGPFESRAEALEAEVNYLNRILFEDEIVHGAEEASKRFLYCREYDNKREV